MGHAARRQGISGVNTAALPTGHLIRLPPLPCPAPLAATPTKVRHKMGLSYVTMNQVEAHLQAYRNWQAHEQCHVSKRKSKKKPYVGLGSSCSLTTGWLVMGAAAGWVPHAPTHGAATNPSGRPTPPCTCSLRRKKIPGSTPEPRIPQPLRSTTTPSALFVLQGDLPGGPGCTDGASDATQPADTASAPSPTPRQLAAAPSAGSSDCACAASSVVSAAPRVLHGTAFSPTPSARRRLSEPF